MIETIEFEAKRNFQSEIRLHHSTGEVTILLFNSNFPLQAQNYYLHAINELLSKKPDLSPQDDLLSIFSLCFVRNSLEMPLGVGTSKDEERIRIGNRIREIREENHLEAKALASLTGIDAANLCRIEQGKQSVGIDILSRIANAMGYKIEFVKLNDM
ncbi:helix-turn-helix transcriptional regulator [Prevotella sp. PINT]|jgi:Helix-turn-helix.|uniref:helix-turn-helix domain-containing protein n=1 Tax=Palleniella intestinalis TaxID=2736291 RepID=UPI0015565AED|nr:helix-turn-helix transcriptional regulator [Palleniella intestinalis]NPD81206.1 helix-turn-helix transcriptional regulator [Palleniella intestinalis]